MDSIAHRLEGLANTATSLKQRELCDEAQPFGAGWMASEAEMQALRRWLHKLTAADFERHTADLKEARLAQLGVVRN